jgi:hypothetical protein
MARPWPINVSITIRMVDNIRVCTRHGMRNYRSAEGGRKVVTDQRPTLGCGDGLHHLRCQNPLVIAVMAAIALAWNKRSWVQKLARMAWRRLQFQKTEQRLHRVLVVRSIVLVVEEMGRELEPHGYLESIVVPGRIQRKSINQSINPR